MRQVKTTVTVEIESNIGQYEEAGLMAIFQQALYNPNAAQEPAIRAASKVTSDAPDEFKIDTLIGEAIAYAIEKQVNETVFQRLIKVSYAETAPPLPPPDEVQPQVIAVPKK
ncbi:MAG TPA: hypothetical protein VM783_17970 [Candidatus Acidoferrum sp.]|nr:hypothetical protein [Candidatus Acidoferrum sp.]